VAAAARPLQRNLHPSARAAPGGPHRFREAPGCEVRRHPGANSGWGARNDALDFSLSWAADCS
jgi:hypothetical protein